MAPQSRAPAVLLTRPPAQSDRFATALRARFPSVSIVSSPLLAPQYLRPVVPLRDWAGAIFTSETGVMAARRIAADGVALPRLAFCVGDQTSRAARAAGFDAVSAKGDGQALVALVRGANVTGPLLYLHGAVVRVDIGGALLIAGIETVSVVCYSQSVQVLTLEAVNLLSGPDPVIAPVFSARTGQILTAEYARIAGIAPLFVAGISRDAVADMPAAVKRVAHVPDAAAMLDVLVTWLA